MTTSSSRPEGERPIRVVFVCMGNTCRSPMAEAVFRHQVAQVGLADRFEISSAGLGPWHVGDPPQPGTLEQLRRNNIPYDGVSRQIRRDELAGYDYVVAMAGDIAGELRAMGGRHAPAPLLFLEPARRQGLVNLDDVPDPYYTGVYPRVYELVDVGSRALLDHIRAERGLP